MGKTYVIDEACWTVELNIVCPKCEDYFNYFDTDEYREGGHLDLKYAQPDPNANIEITCPECGAKLFIKETSC